MFNDYASRYSGKKDSINCFRCLFLSHMCDILIEMSCFPWEFFTEIFLSVKIWKVPQSL